MSHSPDINLRQFYTVDVIRALPRPIDMATFKNWIRRPDPAIPLTDDDAEAATDGRLHLLHFRNATHIALVSELVGLGLAPRRAGLIASHFTHAATERQGRRPGQLFPTGETFLIAYPEAAGQPSVVRLRNLSNQDKLFNELRAGGGARWTSAVVLHVDPVVEYLRQELGLADA